MTGATNSGGGCKNRTPLSLSLLLPSASGKPPEPPLEKGLRGGNQPRLMLRCCSDPMAGVEKGKQVGVRGAGLENAGGARMGSDLLGSRGAGQAKKPCKNPVADKGSENIENSRLDPIKPQKPPGGQLLSWGFFSFFPYFFPCSPVKESRSWKLRSAASAIPLGA